MTGGSAAANLLSLEGAMAGKSEASHADVAEDHHLAGRVVLDGDDVADAGIAAMGALVTASWNASSAQLPATTSLPTARLSAPSKRQIAAPMLNQYPPAAMRLPAKWLV